jgi:hypothetical protein
MFLDERGTGLRVTWHPERDLVVLSVWQGDGCVGTFRMSVQDVPRLSGLLAAALGDWVDQAADPGSAVPALDVYLDRDPQAARDPGGGLVGGGRGGLSVQRRIRLSRAVLKLRGMQHRLRRTG